jgi:exopolysaccharide biosynthesis polyprenyl glycosylphosphotransferase
VIRRHIVELRLGLFLADAVSAALLFVVVSMIRFGTDDWMAIWDGLGVNPLLAPLVYGVAWATTLWFQGLYRLRARWSLRREFLDIIAAALFLAIAVFTVLFLFKLLDVSRLFLLMLFVGQGVVTVLSRALLRFVMTLLRERGFSSRFVLVVGANAKGQAFADRISRHPELGLRVVGHLAIDDELDADGRPKYADLRRPVIGGLDDIEDVLHNAVIDDVAVCLPIEQWHLIEPITRLCEDEGRIVRIPVEEGLVVPGGRIEEFDGIKVMSLVYGPDRIVGLLLKRALDIVLSAAALIILSPFLLIISLVIFVSEGAPILFRQVRVGLHGRPFRLVKFRTMVPDAEQRLAELTGQNEIVGAAFKVTNDPRLTRSGRWLRRTSVDELPQFWNVLRGEMSLVGPRPPLPREVEDYDVWHRRRLSMKPGITGLWQVEARREAEFDRWVAIDLDYIDRWSLWLDLKIILRTIPAVLAGQGR